MTGQIPQNPFSVFKLNLILSVLNDATRLYFKWVKQFFIRDLFNLKTNTMKKFPILSITTLSFVLTLVMVYSESRAQTTASVKKNVIESNKNFMVWFNSGR